MAKRKATAARRKFTPKTSVFKRRSRFLLPWPYIVFIFLCIGVLLSGWTFQASAADLTVTAKLPAPALSEPAIITNPTDGTHFTEAPVTVSGTCPDDSYVKIYRNDFFSGSAICDNTTNIFSLQIDLFPGANVLKAQDFNITDDAGPSSPTVTVYYDVPVAPNPPETTSPEEGTPEAESTPSASSANPAMPFIVKTNFNYQGFSVGQIVQWQLEASGGYPPYAINVDWGDGTNSVVSRSKEGKFNIDHIYKKQGTGPKNSYIIKASGADSAKNKAFVQFFVIINPSKLGAIVANTLPTSPVKNNWLLLAWPAYLVLLLMITSFWLGERQEVINLKRRGMLRLHRT